jgi:hypothetical protein
MAGQAMLPRSVAIEEIPTAIKEFTIKMIVDKNLHATVKSAIQYYVAQYNARDVTEAQKERIKHDDLAHQVGYIYKYYNSHVELVLKTLEEITMKKDHEEKLRKIFQSEVVRVCCLGGGPLPEIIALYMFIKDNMPSVITPTDEEQRVMYMRIPSTDQESGKIISDHPIRPLLSVRNLDLHAESWKQRFDEITPLVLGKARVYIPTENINPINCDLTDPEEVRQHIDEVRRSRLIFASKVFSDIWCLNPDQVMESADIIIKNIQPGSIFVYMDNQNGVSVSWFCNYKWKAWGFVQIYSYDDSYEPKNPMQPIDIAGFSVKPGKQGKRMIIKVYYRKEKPDSPLNVRERTGRSQAPPDVDKAQEMEFAFWKS